jgi:hypothetical protein
MGRGAARVRASRFACQGSDISGITVGQGRGYLDFGEALEWAELTGSVKFRKDYEFQCLSISTFARAYRSLAVLKFRPYA